MTYETPMNPEAPKRYKRRSPELWQNLVDQFHQSGLSGAKFCREYNITYANFCKWHQKLSAHSAVSDTTQPGFIDLSLLSPSPALETHTPPWHIVLKLGNGVELCLSQAHAAT